MEKNGKAKAVVFDMQGARELFDFFEKNMLNTRGHDIYAVDEKSLVAKVVTNLEDAERFFNGASGAV